MICPRCGSQNVNIQVITNTKLKDKHHGVGWWLFVGWWWVPCKWFFFTLPALIIKLIGHKKQKVVQTQQTVCICQQCGNQWAIKQ